MQDRFVLRQKGLLCPRKRVVKRLQATSDVRRRWDRIICYPPSHRYPHRVDSVLVEEIEIFHSDESVPVILQYGKSNRAPKKLTGSKHFVCASPVYRCISLGF